MRRIYSTQQEQEQAKEGQQQEKQQQDVGTNANSTMDFISGFG